MGTKILELVLDFFGGRKTHEQTEYLYLSLLQLLLNCGKAAKLKIETYLEKGVLTQS